MVECVMTFVFQEESDGVTYPYTEVVRVEIDTEGAARDFIAVLREKAAWGHNDFVHFEKMKGTEDMEATVGDGPQAFVRIVHTPGEEPLIIGLPGGHQVQIDPVPDE